MAKYLVAFSIDSDEEFTESELREMLDDNCFQHIDGAPFVMNKLYVKNVTENYDGVLDDISDL